MQSLHHRSRQRRIAPCAYNEENSSVSPYCRNAGRCIAQTVYTKKNMSLPRFVLESKFHRIYTDTYRYFICACQMHRSAEKILNNNKTASYFFFCSPKIFYIQIVMTYCSAYCWIFSTLIPPLLGRFLI